MIKCYIRLLQTPTYAYKLCSKLLKGLKVTQSTERGKTIDRVLSYYVINLRASNVNTVSTKLQCQCAALVHYFLLHQACNLAL